MNWIKSAFYSTKASDWALRSGLENLDLNGDFWDNKDFNVMQTFIFLLTHSCLVFYCSVNFKVIPQQELGLYFSILLKHDIILNHQPFAEFFLKKSANAQNVTANNFLTLLHPEVPDFGWYFDQMCTERAFSQFFIYLSTFFVFKHLKNVKCKNDHFICAKKSYQKVHFKDQKGVRSARRLTEHWLHLFSSLFQIITSKN